MNTALLEELVRRKAEEFQSEGISALEAVDRAGDEIFQCVAEGNGHGSRFCLRMWLKGAKKRLSSRENEDSSCSEEGKVRNIIRCVENPCLSHKPGVRAA